MLLTNESYKTHARRAKVAVKYEANDLGNLNVLEESDIPCASLHGMKPVNLMYVDSTL